MGKIRDFPQPKQTCFSIFKFLEIVGTGSSDKVTHQVLHSSRFSWSTAPSVPTPGFIHERILGEDLLAKIRDRKETGEAEVKRKPNWNQVKIFEKEFRQIYLPPSEKEESSGWYKYKFTPHRWRHSLCAHQTRPIQEGKSR